MIKPWRTIRCRSCGSEYGWNGNYLEMPACPHCKYDMPKSEKEKLQKGFDDMIEGGKKKLAIRRKDSGDEKRGVHRRTKTKKRRRRRDD